MLLGSWILDEETDFLKVETKTDFLIRRRFLLHLLAFVCKTPQSNFGKSIDFLKGFKKTKFRFSPSKFKQLSVVSW